MLDFFKRKCSYSSEVNVGLPTTNVAIPIPKSVDAPILKNVDAPILENVEDAPILENVHFPIPENVDVPISQHNFKESILILWIMIPEHANKYGNIM